MQYNSFKKVGELFSRATVLKAALASSATFGNNNDATNVRVDIEIWTVTGTSIVFTLEYYDDAKDDWRTLLASSAQTGAGHVTLEAGLNMTTASNAKVQCVLPKKLRLTPSEGASLTSAEFAASYTLV